MVRYASIFAKKYSTPFLSWRVQYILQYASKIELKYGMLLRYGSRGKVANSECTVPYCHPCVDQLFKWQPNNIFASQFNFDKYIFSILKKLTVFLFVSIEANDGNKKRICEFCKEGKHNIVINQYRPHQENLSAKEIQKDVAIFRCAIWILQKEAPEPKVRHFFV